MKNIFKFLSLIIVAFVTLYSCIMVWIKPEVIGFNGSILSYDVNDSVLFSLISLVVIVFTIPIKRHMWKYLFAILLGMGIADLVDFQESVHVITIGGFSIKIFSFSMLILHLALNRDCITDLIKSKKGIV